MLKVLYICTHNRCRSILSEAITNQDAGNLIMAKSAGSHPAGEVHPLTLRYLVESGFSAAGLESQSWDEFASFAPDVVITVCDAAAGESCPLWFADTIRLHWGLEDPSKIAGNESEQKVAFEKCISVIRRRVAALAQLAEKQLQGQALKQALAGLSGAQQTTQSPLTTE